MRNIVISAVFHKRIVSSRSTSVFSSEQVIDGADHLARMANRKSRIIVLSDAISYHTAILDAFHTSNNLPQLCFKADGPIERDYPPDLERSRVMIEEASLELNELVKHPRDLLTERAEKHAARAFIAKFEIAKHVPNSKQGDISYQTLAEKVGVDVGALESLMRLAISHRIFSEPDHGRLAHSPASRLLRDSWEIESARGNAFADEVLPMVSNVAEALGRYPQAAGFLEAASAVADNLDRRDSVAEVVWHYVVRDDNLRDVLRQATMVPGMA